MAHLPILRYPDPRLHTVAKPVAEVDDRIRQLVDDMLETMYDAQGIGLAATQVDVHERVIVIDISEARDEPLVLINPEIDRAQRRDDARRRRLPVGARIYDEVPRHARVTVRALDRDGEPLRVRRPRACSRCACSTRWTTCWARCSSSTCQPLKRNRIKTKMLKKTREEARRLSAADAACAA